MRRYSHNTSRSLALTRAHADDRRYVADDEIRSDAPTEGVDQERDEGDRAARIRKNRSVSSPVSAVRGRWHETARRRNTHPMTHDWQPTHDPKFLADDDLLTRLVAGVRPPDGLRSSARAWLSRYGGLRRFVRLPVTALAPATDITPDDACRLEAGLELARRLAGAESGEEFPPIADSGDVYRLVRFDMADLVQEVFEVLVLDARHRVRDRVRITQGILTGSLVHPREIFREAIVRSAAAIIVVHNHPSGDPTPSAEDRELTRRLVRAGEVVGVPVLDHVVIGDGCHASLAEWGEALGAGRGVSTTIAPAATVAVEPEFDFERERDGDDFDVEDLDVDVAEDATDGDQNETENRMKSATMTGTKTTPTKRVARLGVTHYRIAETTAGWVGLVGSDAGLARSFLPFPTREEAVASIRREFVEAREDDTSFDAVVVKLRRYFAGEPVDLDDDVTIDDRGVTPFRRRIYEELRRVPRGETVTYGQLAEAAGRPGAARGVGGAMAANPFPPFVPCHRVLGAGERLVGFSAAGGLDLKAKMLAIEQDGRSTTSA